MFLTPNRRQLDGTSVGRRLAGGLFAGDFDRSGGVCGGDSDVGQSGRIQRRAGAGKSGFGKFVSDCDNPVGIAGGGGGVNGGVGIGDMVVGIKIVAVVPRGVDSVNVPFGRGGNGGNGGGWRRRGGA